MGQIIIRYLSFLKYSIFAILLSGCAEPISYRSAQPPSLTLSWTNPNQFEDTSILIPYRDLSESRLYYGDSNDNVRTNIIILPPMATSFPLINLDMAITETYVITYIGLTVVSFSGAESNLSEIIQLVY